MDYRIRSFSWIVKSFRKNCVMHRSIAFFPFIIVFAWVFLFADESGRIEKYSIEQFMKAQNSDFTDFILPSVPHLYNVPFSTIGYGNPESFGIGSFFAGNDTFIDGKFVYSAEDGRLIGRIDLPDDDIYGHSTIGKDDEYAILSTHGIHIVRPQYQDVQFIDFKSLIFASPSTEKVLKSTEYMILPYFDHDNMILIVSHDTFTNTILKIERRSKKCVVIGVMPEYVQLGKIASLNFGVAKVAATEYIETADKLVTRLHIFEIADNCSEIGAFDCDMIFANNDFSKIVTANAGLDGSDLSLYSYTEAKFTKTSQMHLTSSLNCLFFLGDSIFAFTDGDEDSSTVIRIDVLGEKLTEKSRDLIHGYGVSSNPANMKILLRSCSWAFNVLDLMTLQFRFPFEEGFASTMTTDAFSPEHGVIAVTIQSEVLLLNSETLSPVGAVQIPFNRHLFGLFGEEDGFLAYFRDDEQHVTAGRIVLDTIDGRLVPRLIPNIHEAPPYLYHSVSSLSFRSYIYPYSSEFRDVLSWEFPGRKLVFIGNDFALLGKSDPILVFMKDAVWHSHALPDMWGEESYVERINEATFLLNVPVGAGESLLVDCISGKHLLIPHMSKACENAIYYLDEASHKHCIVDYAKKSAYFRTVVESDDFIRWLSKRNSAIHFSEIEVFCETYVCLTYKQKDLTELDKKIIKVFEKERQPEIGKQ